MASAIAISKVEPVMDLIAMEKTGDKIEKVSEISLTGQELENLITPSENEVAEK